MQASTGSMAGTDRASALRQAATSRRAGLIAITAIVLIVGAPALAVLASLFSPAGPNQAHIWETTGPRYLFGTLALCAMVGLATTIIGVGAAALVTLTEFPGRRLLALALAAPLAAPAYIVAYCYGDLMGPFGIIGASLRGFAGAGSFIELRSLPGAAFILTVTTYPYVYLAVRASLGARSGAMFEAARSLGASPQRVFFRVFMPSIRAALAGGVALALMETAADFGVADYLGAQTLGVGIFRTWYGLGDLAAASQIAAALLAFAACLTFLEILGRRGRVSEPTHAGRPFKPYRLSPLAAFGAFAFCAIPVALGVGAPVAVLAGKLFVSGFSLTPAMSGAAINTAALSLAGASVAMALALLLAYAARADRRQATAVLIRFATLGYAVPGAVMAIGVLAVAQGAGALFGPAGGVTAGVAALLYAYVARFLTAGYNSAAGGLAQISPSADAAARALGAGPLRVATRIHLPIASGALIAGLMIVFIDIARELPATLLLRDFNFETLATRVYRLASDERLAEAAPDALALIALGIAPMLLIARHQSDGQAFRRPRTGQSPFENGPSP